MSCRVDSTLIAGACVVGNRGLGVLGSVIRATTAVGDAGPGFLYNDWQAGDDNKEFRGLIVTPPSAGSFVADEDGTFDLTGAPDGGYSFTYRLFVDGVDLGTATSFITVGDTTAVSVDVTGLAAISFTGTGAVAVTINAGPDPALTVTVTGLADFTVTAYGEVSLSVVDVSTAPTVPMLDWDLWEPYVLPYAAGCPDATMVFHVRQAAIEFCRYTKVWQASLSPLVADGASTAFQMQAPSESEVGKLLALTVTRAGYNPLSIEVVTPDVGMQRMLDGAFWPCAYSDGAGSIIVWPAQAAGAVLTPRAVLAPSVRAAQCPQFIYNRYASDIAAGALASILSMPNQPWTDLKSAAICYGQFNARKATVSLVVERGNAKSTRKVTTRWF